MDDGIIIFLSIVGGLLTIIIDVAVALEFNSIAKEKGAERNYFWWSLVGIPGWLMVAALPDRRKEGEHQITKSIKSSGTNAQTEIYDKGDVTLGHFACGDSTIRAIEWDILKKDDGKALLISKYAIGSKPYNAVSTDANWENCTLRAWLNDEFLSKAFSDTEKAKIIPSIVTRNNTEDKVFLLSEDEVNTLFESYGERSCKMRNGSDTWWWLRADNDNTKNVAFVDLFGRVHTNGENAADDKGGVRPAMWINLEP